MIGQKLEIIYGLDAVSPEDAWGVISQFLQEQRIHSSTPVKLYDQEMCLGEVRGEINKFSREHFQVKLLDSSFGYGAISAWEHVLITIEDRSESEFFNWELLVNLFLNKAKFIQAWLSDANFVFWQNAKDPLQFKAYDKSFEGLPMKSNELPPPLEQLEIDISENPGRRIIKMGYVEAIGAIMWVGEEFWNRITTSETKAKEELATQMKSICETVWRIQVSKTLFTDTTDINIQENLRRILYKRKGTGCNGIV